MSTCTEHRMLNMLHHSSIFCQLAQARPHNVLHFLVTLCLAHSQSDGSLFVQQGEQQVRDMSH